MMFFGRKELDKQGYITLIVYHDKTLSSLRELWMDEKEEAQRDRLMRAINEGLDTRLGLMSARDACES